MSTTYTTNAGLAKPARADRNWDVQLNANADALDACAAVGGLAVTTRENPSASLNVKVAPGQFRKSDGTLVTFAGAPAQAVAPNATTALWLTEAGALATGGAFPAGANVVRLALVTAGASAVTGISDQRTPWFSFGAQATTSGTVTSVGLALPPDYVVSGSPVTTSGVLTAVRANQNPNVVLAGPTSGTPAPPNYRALVGADLPVFGASGAAHAAGAVPDPGGTAGATRFLREDAIWAVPPGGGGSAGVTSVGLTLPLPFSVSGSPVTSTGTLAATWTAQPANQVFAGPTSGTPGTPSFRALVGADLPVFGASGAAHAAGAVPDPGGTAGATRFLREDATWAVPPGGGGGAGVTSVALALPSQFAVSGSPVTATGTLTAGWNPQGANQVFAGPASGTPGAPNFRALVGADLPVFGASGPFHAPGAVPDPGATAGSRRFLREDGTWAAPATSTASPLSQTVVSSPSYTCNGSEQWLTVNYSGAVTIVLPAGTSGQLLYVTDLSGGSRAANPITFTASGSGSILGAGQITSNYGGVVFLADGLQDWYAVAQGGYPVFGASGPSHATGLVPDPGPVGGSARYLREDGNWATPSGSSVALTSVGLNLPGDFVVSGSPLTGSGAITAYWAPQAQSQFFAAPSTGYGTPSWRLIAPADLPVFGGSGPSHTPGAVPDPGATAGTMRFLREDGTWAPPSGAASSTTLNTTTPAAYPYTCSASDALVLVDSSQARTVTLPSASSAGAGRVYLIKDATGSAFTNPVTVTVAGGGTIDGASQTLIATNYGEAEFVSDGTNWKRKFNRPDLVDGNLTVTRKLLVGGNLNLSPCSFTAQTITLNPNLTINQVNYTGAGGVTATLPTAASVGSNAVLIVKDIAGTAGSKNITIRPQGSDTLDGGTQLVISTNYGAARLYCDGVGAWYTW